jgi:hypothetical protein
MRWNSAPHNAFCQWLADLVNHWPPPNGERLELHASGFKRIDDSIGDGLIASTRKPEA